MQYSCFQNDFNKCKSVNFVVNGAKKYTVFDSTQDIFLLKQEYYREVLNQHNYITCAPT